MLTDNHSDCKQRMERAAGPAAPPPMGGQQAATLAAVLGRRMEGPSGPGSLESHPVRQQRLAQQLLQQQPQQQQPSVAPNASVTAREGGRKAQPSVKAFFESLCQLAPEQAGSIKQLYSSVVAQGLDSPAILHMCRVSFGAALVQSALDCVKSGRQPPRQPAATSLPGPPVPAADAAVGTQPGRQREAQPRWCSWKELFARLRVLAPEKEAVIQQVCDVAAKAEGSGGQVSAEQILSLCHTHLGKELVERALDGVRAEQQARDSSQQAGSSAQHSSAPTQATAPPVPQQAPPPAEAEGQQPEGRVASSSSSSHAVKMEVDEPVETAQQEAPRADGAASAQQEAPPRPTRSLPGTRTWEQRLATIWPTMQTMREAMEEQEGEEEREEAPGWKVLEQVGWKQEHRLLRGYPIIDPQSRFWFTPEGFRKRPLPLPARVGSEVFRSWRDVRAFVLQRMEGFLQNPEPSAEEGASSCVLMVALPTVGNEGRKFKTYYWPARLATQTEATAWKNEKAGFTKVPNRDEVYAVVLCAPLVHGIHLRLPVHRDRCKRVTLSELQFMIDLAKTRKASGDDGGLMKSLNRPLEDQQLTDFFLAGLAYALAFAKLGGRLVPPSLRVDNDDAVVPSFADDQLHNPWGSSSSSDMEVGESEQVPPCQQCSSEAEAMTCAGPRTVALGLRHMATSTTMAVSTVVAGLKRKAPNSSSSNGPAAASSEVKRLRDDKGEAASMGVAARSPLTENGSDATAPAAADSGDDLRSEASTSAPAAAEADDGATMATTTSTAMQVDAPPRRDPPPAPAPPATEDAAASSSDDEIEIVAVVPARHAASRFVAPLQPTSTQAASAPAAASEASSTNDPYAHIRIVWQDEDQGAAPTGAVASSASSCLDIPAPLAAPSPPPPVQMVPPSAPVPAPPQQPPAVGAPGSSGGGGGAGPASSNAMPATVLWLSAAETKTYLSMQGVGMDELMQSLREAEVDMPLRAEIDTLVSKCFVGKVNLNMDKLRSVVEMVYGQQNRVDFLERFVPVLQRVIRMCAVHRQRRQQQQQQQQQQAVASKQPAPAPSSASQQQLQQQQQLLLSAGPSVGCNVPPVPPSSSFGSISKGTLPIDPLVARFYDAWRMVYAGMQPDQDETALWIERWRRVLSRGERVPASELDAAHRAFTHRLETRKDAAQVAAEENETRSRAKFWEKARAAVAGLELKQGPEDGAVRAVAAHADALAGLIGVANAEQAEMKLRESEATLLVVHQDRQALQMLSAPRKERLRDEIVRAEEEWKRGKAWVSALRKVVNVRKAAQELEGMCAELQNAQSLHSNVRMHNDVALQILREAWANLRQALFTNTPPPPVATASASSSSAGAGVVVDGGGGGLKTLLMFDVRCRDHPVPLRHCEQPKRVELAIEGLTALADQHPGSFSLSKECGSRYFPVYRSARQDFIPEALRVHDKEHLECMWRRCQAAGSGITRISKRSLEAMRKPSNNKGSGSSGSSSSSEEEEEEDEESSDEEEGVGGEPKGDTFGNRYTLTAASAGFASTLEAVDAVVSGSVANAFIACRPPGHHAERNMRRQRRGWGFCFLNYAAGAAVHAVMHHKLDRVTVVDFDFHHGNGTEDILTSSTHRQSFQFISIHSKRAFPNTGHKSRFPHVVNLPIEGRMTKKRHRAMWAQVDEAIDAFKPSLIVVSCGFDAHINDPIHLGERSRERNAGMLTAEDYYDLTQRLVNLANKHCMGRIVGVMEGGYCCEVPLAPRPLHVEADPRDGESSDEDILCAVACATETLRHCVDATCRALAGMEFRSL